MFRNLCILPIFLLIFDDTFAGKDYDSDSFVTIESAGNRVILDKDSLSTASFAPNFKGIQINSQLPDNMGGNFFSTYAVKLITDNSSQSQEYTFTADDLFPVTTSFKQLGLSKVSISGYWYNFDQAVLKFYRTAELVGNVLVTKNSITALKPFSSITALDGYMPNVVAPQPSITGGQTIKIDCNNQNDVFDPKTIFYKSGGQGTYCLAMKNKGSNCKSLYKTKPLQVYPAACTNFDPTDNYNLDNCTIFTAKQDPLIFYRNTPFYLFSEFSTEPPLNAKPGNVAPYKYVITFESILTVASDKVAAMNNIYEYEHHVTKAPAQKKAVSKVLQRKKPIIKSARKSASPARSSVGHKSTGPHAEQKPPAKKTSAASKGGRQNPLRVNHKLTNMFR